MDKFSNQFLSYYDQLPRGEASVFLSVWIWKIFAPVATEQRKINFFQHTILEFLHIDQQDRLTIANWMGVDLELVDLIIDTELEPNGWIQVNHDRWNLTESGLRLLEDEIEQQTDLQPYYLIQDAITGKLWHRLIPNKLHSLETTEHNGKVQILGSRDSGRYIEPFMVEPKNIFIPKAPSHNQILQTIKHHNWAVRGQNVRSHDEQRLYLDQQNLKNYEFYDQSPEAFYILSHIDHNQDSAHICQLQDPCHISQFDDWIQNLHIEIATKHKPFSDKVKRSLGQNIDENETIDEFEERLLQEISFELAIDFPYAHKIANLEKHLSRLLARKKQLEEKGNYYDIDDLINQCQKALEACFKQMLKTWQHKHADTTPKNMRREAIKTALILRSGQYFDERLLEQFCTVNASHVFSANGFSAGRFPNIGVSLKPLIVSSLLCIPDHQPHPLIQRSNAQQDLASLLKMCESRNDSTHDSANEIDIPTALALSQFTLDWVSFFTAIEA